MAAKSKKRLSKIDNKLLKLNYLELKDVICSICHSILIEPVTLPCFHDFCLRCFNGSVENSALCCPLCRLRIGSWLRTATKQKNLVNIELWNYIQSKFSQEISIKENGDDIVLPDENPLPRLSAPGEIKTEYEAELKRLRAERLRIEQKHFQETENLIKKFQEEEELANATYLESLKQDEILALQMQNDLKKESPTFQNKTQHKNMPQKPRLKSLKTAKIESFLTQTKSPLLTDDNTNSTDSSTPKLSSFKTPINHGSPEMVPTYGKLFRSLIDKKAKNGPGVWNKENGNTKEKKDNVGSKAAENTDDKKFKNKHVIQSLLVSLPLSCTSILQHKTNAAENKNLETDSVDSMRQELCFFKPIQGATPTSFNNSKRAPVRVPCVRAVRKLSPRGHGPPPTRAQYLESLCRLRNLSLTKKLPSAFVIALNVLRVEKEQAAKTTNSKSKRKKTMTSPFALTLSKKNVQKKITPSDSSAIPQHTGTNLRRTRSMGSITNEDNETTPKKAKQERKSCSDRKPYLRSDSKRSNTKKEPSSPTLAAEGLNNNKLNLVVKNLSSPLKNCDVKQILQEQLRIEKLIEQEKDDFELARQVHAEWNGRRLPRRGAVKRQLTLNYALRPAKKVRV